MADVKINLEATHKEFLAAITAASKATTTLLGELGKLETAHTKTGTAANKHAESTTKANTATHKTAQNASTATASVTLLAGAIGKTVAGYYLLIAATKALLSATSGTFNAVIQNIDDFKRGTIGAAAAMTNIADLAVKGGSTWGEVFNANLKATQQTFLELERLSAKYFASSIDLQLAYNAFAQRGIIIRRQELPLLAQLTDLILLLTQGQQSYIQVQEEIRSLVTGTIRPTAQLSQLIKSFGLNVKDVAAEIRATQSLKPLEGILRGAAQATNEIQKTFTATKNGLEVIIRQIGRFGLDAFYNNIVGAIQSFTSLLTANKSSIVAVFAVIGKVTSDAIVSVEKFTGAFIKSTVAGKDSVSNVVEFFTVIETVFGTLMTILNAVVELLKAIPNVIKTSFDLIAESINLGPAIETALSFWGPKVDAGIEKLKEWGSALKEVVTGSLTDRGKTFMDQLSKDTEGATKAVGEATTAITGFGDKLKQNRKELQKAANVGAALATGSGLLELGVPTNIPFAPKPEDLEKTGRLTNALTQAQDRLNRSLRITDELEVASAIDVDLVSLRRTLTLVEQGFVAIGDSVVGIRSVVGNTTDFVSRNMETFITGAKANFSTLVSAIADTTSGITGGVLDNLEAQLERARVGLEEFKQAAAEAKARLFETQVFNLQRQARSESQEALKDYQNILDVQKLNVAVAQEAYDLARKGTDATKIENARRTLVHEQQLANIAQQNAAQRQADDLHRANLVAEIALANEGRLTAQETAQVAVEKEKLDKEMLRIEQAKNAEYGKMLKLNVDITSAVRSRLIEQQRKLPRTSLEAGQADIADIELKQSVELGDAVGQRRAILNSVVGDLTQAQAAALQSVDALILSLETLHPKVITTAQAVNDFAVSFSVIDSAVKNTANTLFDALLNSFEGKKTNFVSAFKTITDSIFKDSMKNIIESVSASLQTGFKDIASSIAPGMASTLGPAFMAGFALIASFVLGQLLQGDGGSASAGNPQVGIQSTEQVRGLIGGETQIPIGLVGESLQDALVPTNLLLSRIAAGVDRLSFGGIDPSIIESTISRSVSDALQIQLSAT